MRAHISAIGHVCVTTPDLARLVAFYRDVLGLKHVVDAGNFQAFEIGPVHVCVVPGPVQQMSFDLAAEDVEGFRQHLRRHGVSCTGIVTGTYSGHHGFDCIDPDGRTIGITSAHTPLPAIASDRVAS